MNKQELIDYCNALKESKGRFINCIDVDRIIDTIKQLDEPEKVKVPQCVADWIEYCKFTHVDFQHALIVGDVYFYNYANQKDFSKLKEFLETENNQETFARAWLDGYEVEKEKRYLVKVKGMNRINGCLAHNKELATWYFGISGNSKNHRTNHTRKQLEEAGFSWVFDCPGIVIEEVE